MLAVYAVFVLAFLILGAVIAWAFFKYRFKGDRTTTIIAIYVVMVLATILMTLSLLRPMTATQATPF